MVKNLKDIIEHYGQKNFNSFTKYPSIETYHEIDKGILNANLTNPDGFGDDQCYATEKVDGTNGRIIIFNGDFIIGSREELLYRKGDMFGNPDLGIVQVMKPYAQHLAECLPADDTLYTFYGEVYGSNILNHKNYTKNNQSNVRFFDIVKTTDLTPMEKDPQRISTWREHGGQKYLDVQYFHSLLDALKIDNTHRVPYIIIINGKDIPKDRKNAFKWLSQFETTKAAIDNDYFQGDRAYGKAEGVVVRNSDRTKIYKIRFEDYQKTIKQLGSLD